MNPYLLHHLLWRAVEDHPDRVAVELGPETLTYGELEAASSGLADALVRFGVAPGDRVGIMVGKAVNAIACLYGILAAGAVYVPIDPASPPERVGHIIRSCQIRVLITSASGAARITEMDAKGELEHLVLFDDGIMDYSVDLSVHSLAEILASDKRLPRGDSISSNSPAYILHTSGSTGVPKGVVLSHRNALAFVNTAVEYFGLIPDDRFSGHAPLHFDLSVFDLFCAAAVAGTIVLVPDHLSMFPVKLAQFLAESRITVFNAVASVGAILAAKGKMESHDFGSMRLFLFSGDVMPVKYLRVLTSAMPEACFYNIYGQTEANSTIAYLVEKIPEDDGWKVPIGRALPDFEAFAVREDGGLVEKPGEKGELHIAGPTVGLGYWGDPERSDSGFVQDPRTDQYRSMVYRTGDLVTQTKDGDFLFLGREDHMVKSRGYRIQLDEIEAVLSTHEQIKEAVALAIPNETLGNRIVSCVVAEEGQEPGMVELKEHCGRYLPHYMIPETIRFYPTFPRTSSGKVNRKELAAKTTSRPEESN